MSDRRFYYDSAASPVPFTEAQLVQLRKSSLARVRITFCKSRLSSTSSLLFFVAQVTCDNGDNIKSMQPLAFRTPSKM